MRLACDTCKSIHIIPDAHGGFLPQNPQGKDCSLAQLKHLPFIHRDTGFDASSPVSLKEGPIQGIYLFFEMVSL